MLVKKQISLALVELKMDADTGSFEGYASRFGGVDTYGDTIIKGAFASTLRQNGKPKMFFNHEWNMPIGKYPTAKEDDNGLFVKGEFTPGMSKSGDVRSAMQHGTIEGLSIGGYVAKGDAEDKADGSGQIIHKFTRLVEVSPVVFPADAGARIDMATVRGQDIDEALEGIETVRDFERFLRDAGGHSKGLAAALVSRAKVIFGQGEPVTKAANADKDALIERLNRLATLTA